MSRDEERVLVWAPQGRDSALAVALLARQGMTALACQSVEEIVDNLMASGCAILVAEALNEDARARLKAALEMQPPWSDFPLIVFAPRGAGRASDAFFAAQALGNVTVLERPVLGRTLVSTVVAALRARARQYEARAAIHRRDQFLAMLGHELRNPLGAIVLALESLHAISGDVGTKQRMIIDRQARHLARLVDDLLDVARVTTGKVTLKRARLELNQLAQRCVQNAEMTARSREIALTFHAEPDPVHVDGDAVRLEEVLGNLIGNAIKYSPEHSRVDVTVRAADDGSCSVDVADTGIGIAPTMLERVFDLFAQEEGTLDRSQGGLGIGLTLARSLIELHGGSVHAHSEGVGHGSRFTVRLPVATKDSPTGVRRRTHPVELPRALRVVLVDDNADLLDMTKDLLESFGCKAVGAADGPAGLALILDQRPDIAFVDIGLPGLDGYQIASRVREVLGRGPHLVAISGYGQAEDRVRALEAGFDNHLIKPVSVDSLKRELAACREGSAGHAAATDAAP